jgi:hypothetical protein
MLYRATIRSACRVNQQVVRMSRSKIFLCSVVLLFFTSICSLATLSQTSSSTPPQYSVGPITDYSAAQPDYRDVLRFRRGERYNSPNSPLPELGDQSDSQLFAEDTGNYYRDPMPFSHSDAVVVGNITSGQAYLSNDKRDVYSEFQIIIQEVLKEPSARQIGPGDSIAVERYGGAIRLPSGKALIRGITEFSMPLVGKRYLLFLRYDQNAEDFLVQGGYQLEGEHTYSLNDLGSSPAERQHGTIVHPLKEHGNSEEQLLDRARVAARPSVKGGK